VEDNSAFVLGHGVPVHCGAGSALERPSESPGIRIKAWIFEVQNGRRVVNRVTRYEMAEDGSDSRLSFVDRIVDNVTRCQRRRNGLLHCDGGRCISG
jgi:hypothetical protein